MSQATKFFGGSDYTSTGSDIQLVAYSKRVQVVSPTGAGVSVKMPAATDLKTGGPVFFVINVNTDSITLRNKGGGSLITLAEDEVGVLCLADNSTENGVWLAAKDNLVGEQAA